MSNINTSLTMQKAFAKSQVADVNDLIVNLTSIVSDKSAQRKVLDSRYKSLLKRLNGQVNALNEKLDMELDEKMDQKIQ